MGCGNSKLAPEGEEVPPRIRPLLRRRFLEMRKRRNGNVLKDGGLSKKNLLKDGEDEDDSHSSPPHSEVVDSKSTSSSSSSSSQKKEKLPEKPEPTEKAIKDVKEQDNKEAERTLVEKNVDITSTSKKEDKENVKKGEKDKPKIGGELKQKEATREKEEEEEEKEEEDDDEDDDGAGEDDRFICPGSPSFRVYFLDAAENEKKKVAEEEDEDEEDDSPQKKTQSDDSFGSNEFAASNTAEERKSSKKGKRGRAFRRAIKKGGPVAVKNLLNVKSCYHPGCASGSGHDRATLLDGKAAAA